MTFRAAKLSEAPAALELLLTTVADEDRSAYAEELLAELPRGTDQVGGLFVMAEQDGVRGVGLAQLHAGRTASVWRPRFTRGGALKEEAEPLIRACADWAAAQGTRLAQSLLELDDVAAAEWFPRAGFSRLARLAYLVWEANAQGEEDKAASLTFTPRNPENNAAFAKLVEETYSGTLDCPALNGVREISDVLAGYQTVGVFDDALWLLILADARPVGCLILADHPAARQCELVYMGVVPAARGTGFGRQIIAEAKRLTVARGRERLVLAVDVANLPALRQYHLAGFGVWDQREVFARVLRAE